MKNVILIGMPGTGKSTVGVILAKRIGYDFLDEDIAITLKDGRQLSEIIEQEGIDRFLEIEGEVGLGIEAEKTVIATGGSAVFSDDAMRHFKENGICVWLETPIAVLEERLINGSREERGVAAPAEMTLSDIYALREPLYKKYADIRIVCDCDADGVARKIKEKLKGQL